MKNLTGEVVAANGLLNAAVLVAAVILTLVLSY